MSGMTISAFVSKLISDPIDTTTAGGDRSWLPSYPSIEVHTGQGTFRIPWARNELLPPLGTTIRLSIEWDDPT